MRKKENADSTPKRKRAKSGAAGALLAGVIIGIIVFAVMLYMEKAVLNEEEKVAVYVAQSDVPNGTKIDEGNAGSYFEIKDIPKSLVPSNAIFDTAEFAGMYTEIDISKGQTLTESMFVNQDEVLAAFDNPVVAGFSTAQLYRSVNGTLRTGDFVDIYYVEDIDLPGGEKSSVSVLVWENVFLDGPYTSDGHLVSNDGKETSLAQAFNIFLEKDQVEAFYGGLSDGNLVLVRDVNATIGTQRMVNSIADAKAAARGTANSSSNTGNNNSMSSDPFDLFVPDVYADEFNQATGNN